MGSILQYTNCYNQGSRGRGGIWCPYRLPDNSPVMGEIAEELPPAAQNGSEGNNLNLELRSGIDIMTISSETTTVRCRWVGCKQWFGHLELLASHVTRVHATSGKGGLFYCGWEGCTRGDRGFNARYKMLVHVRTHTNEKPHHCFKCDKSFSRAENLKIHARSHTGERPYTCPVPGCGKAYSNSSDRFKHTRTHSVDKPYVCKVPGCPKRYTDPSSLRKHVKTYRHFPLETAIFDKEEEISKQVNNHNSEDDESQSSSDKGMKTPPNNLASISKAAAPKILKRDCNGALKLGCEDQEAKVCANEQCCSPSARPKSPVLCSRSCCIGTDVPALYHGTQFLWNGHNAHYNLFHSWIDADLTLLSRSWASGLSLWSHPIMQPSTCDQRNNGLMSNPEVSSYSFDSAKYNRSELSTKDNDAQDIPLDLTVHRTSNTSV